MLLDVSFERFELDDFSQEMQPYTAAYESFMEYGPSPALEELCYRDQLMISSTIPSQEADQPQAAANVAEGSGAGFLAKIKNWIAKALAKITGFGKHAEAKAVPFAESMTETVAKGTVKSGAKAIPFAVAMNAVLIMSGVGAACAGAFRLLPKIFASSAALEGAAAESASIFSKLRSPFGGIMAKASGSKLKVEISEAEHVVEKVAGGGWTKGALGRLVNAFSAGAKGLFGIIKALAGAVQTTATTGMRWAGSAAKGAIGIADKGAAGAITGMQKQQSKGMFRSFIFGTACFAFVSYLVNSVLKIIRWAFNTAADAVRSVVTAICGSPTTPQPNRPGSAE